MKIKKLTLLSSDIESQRKFYNDILGFTIIDETDDSFSIQVGDTYLTFSFSPKVNRYHYCFLIPKNKIEEAVNWMHERWHLIQSEDDQIIHHFNTWNAHSFYFYDGNKNIAECIVRHDLDNEDTKPFDLTSLLCVNEIGLPSNQTAKLNNQLMREMNSPLWRGDTQRFAINGTQEGLLLLPNYEVKKTWFPTQHAVEPVTVKAIVEHENQLYDLLFESEQLEIKPI